MFIKNCLTPTEKLSTVNPTTRIKEALQLMNQQTLQSLPVINEQKRFLGMVSKRKLFELLEFGSYQGNWSDFLERPIEDAIEPNIPALTFEDNFEDTLKPIVRVPFVPVVDRHGLLLGIVKRSDVTKSLEDAFGINRPGVRLLVGMVEATGQLDRIQHIINGMGINTITNVAFDSNDKFLRRVLIKISPVEEDVLNKLLNQLTVSGFKILTIHIQK